MKNALDAQKVAVDAQKVADDALLTSEMKELAALAEAVELQAAVELAQVVAANKLQLDTDADAQLEIISELVEEAAADGELECSRPLFVKLVNYQDLGALDAMIAEKLIAAGYKVDYRVHVEGQVTDENGVTSTPFHRHVMNISWDIG